MTTHIDGQSESSRGVVEELLDVEYDVAVATGDLVGAGFSGNVLILMQGEIGLVSERRLPNLKWARARYARSVYR